MRKQSVLTRLVTNIVAVVTTVGAINVNANETNDVDSQGRTVADIVAESRARMESKENARRPENRDHAKETKQAEPKPRSWYAGFAFENDGGSISLSELYRVRATQISEVPFQYLEPNDVYLNRSSGGAGLLLGREINDWLDVEVATHGWESFYQLLSETAVARDSMTPDNPRNTDASQVTEFFERSFSLTLLPRWEPNEFFAVYGRVGVGYSKNSLNSMLSLEANVPGPPSCTPDPITRVEKCEETFKFENRLIDARHPESEGFFPIAGVGIQLVQFIRLEYMLRADVPIGSAKTDIRSGLCVSFRMKSEWL